MSALADVRRYDSAVVARGRRDGEAPPIAIQPHDLELIDAVRRYTFLTTPQLAELFWPEASVQAARMRLVALFRAGFLDRFRPLAERGSFPWTYQLGPEGHRLLQRAGILPLRCRFESREVFDYRYVLHEIQVNSWVLAWRRRLGRRLLSWKGEVQIDPPGDLDRGGDRRTEDGRSVHGLKAASPRAVRPDAVIEVSSKDAESVNTFLIEYDRTRRVDKNYDKFRRYDNFLCWWCKGAMGVDQLPWVVFVCQEDVDRERFVAGADVDLAGYLWSGGAGREADAFIGRRRMLFTTAADMYEEAEVVGNRVPRLPKGRRDAGRYDEGGRADRHGTIRLWYATPGWDNYVLLAFTEIRVFGAGSVPVARRLRAALLDLRTVLPADLSAPVESQLQLLDAAVAERFSVAAERDLAMTPDRQGIGSSS